MRPRVLRISALLALPALCLVAGATSAPTSALAQQRGAASHSTPAKAEAPPPAPHAWLFGAWTGGEFPATETAGAACFGNATMMFTRDVVMRSSPLDVLYRQRTVESVAPTAQGVEFRLSPLPQGAPADFGFGCNDPNTLTVQRMGPDEIAFPGCTAFPFTLKRCTTDGK